MAPLSVINYVVAHEVCHLVYPDHSKNFWSLLKTQITDIQEKRDWLSINSPQTDFHLL